MKNDNRIRNRVNELQGLISTWVLAATPNQTSETDRILEEIILKSKEIERMHEGRFDSIDDKINKSIIII